MAYIENYVGESSDNVVNKLFNIYNINFNKRKSIISEYTSTEIGIKFGPSIIKKLFKYIQKYNNPSMEGWMLEIWFFAKLQNEGIKIYDKDDNEEVFEKSDILNFDPDETSDIKNISLLTKSIWLKPSKWNQGGYDTVYVDIKNNTVKFFQITRASEHSFKLKFFVQLMKKFANHFETKILEIYFIIPKKNILKFNIPESKVEEKGSLAAFKGWEKGKEVSNIKIRAIEFDLSEL